MYPAGRGLAVEGRDAECLVKGEDGWGKTGEEIPTEREMEINRCQVNTAYLTSLLKRIYSNMNSFCLLLQKGVEERMSHSLMGK